jgi:hypothetical protein
LGKKVKISNDAHSTFSEKCSTRFLDPSFRLLNMDLHIILMGEECINISLGLWRGFYEQTK